MKIVLKNQVEKPGVNQTFVTFVGAVDKNENLPTTKVDIQIRDLLQSAVQDGAFKGKSKESLFFRESNLNGYKHLAAVGLGESQSLHGEDVRFAIGTMMKCLSANKVQSAVIDIDSLLALSSHPEHAMRAIAEALELSHYEFNEHKSPPKTPKKTVKKSAKGLELTLLVTHLDNVLEEAFELGAIIGRETNFTRSLGDHASNKMTPAILAKTVQEKAKGSKIKVTVWDKARIKKEGFGGLFGVGHGSEEDPRFIIMEYSGAAKTKKPVILVGKGLTFDSGGISIKPAAGMDEMKFDMCGAAAVIGATFALAKIKAKVNVITLVSAAENMPSGRAVKPGDIFTHRNGKTSEVLNTDAEGRLVLADALAFASEKKPQAIFDAATLTGAMVVALGNTHTGFYTKNQDIVKKVQKATETSGEALWHMPLTDDHAEDIRGIYADISNISHFKGAGSATAAAFLEHFVDSGIPWAHFDIAGTANNVSNRLPYITKKGASGVMVRTFVELVKSYF